MSEYGKTATGFVYSAYVKLKDIDRRAAEMIETISNTSWIDSLKAVEKLTFEARSKRTIEKLVNQILSHYEIPKDEDTKYLIDIDLSILGSPLDKFYDYEKNIRKEYEFVPIDLFREKRSELLKSFLN